MRSLRRGGTGALAVATALTSALTILLPAPPASSAADDKIVFKVVGTSDIEDSNLRAAVIEPGFEAAYPQYDLQYTSKGTGAALADARQGLFSAAVVHAYALENQFVAEGFSAEPYGRAVFWGDYVLLGPADDPAGVLTNAPHDIVTAFERVAAAGANGTADFVSRGGTPGTTVQEHAIWALTDGVQTCEVPATRGGGEAPSTATGACPATIPKPSWYKETGLTQGPNVKLGDTCPAATFSSGKCYVFTDRGTFNYLDSLDGQAGVDNLGILTRDNDVAGQLDLLINSFHAYAVNPDKFADNPNASIDLVAATRFLDYMTSPAAQRSFNEFLDDAGDPPFLPSAAPALTITSPPLARLVAGNSVAVTGSIANVTPGTPALSNEVVRLLARPSNRPIGTSELVATTRTDSAGRFTLRHQPSASVTYTVDVPQITKIQFADLDPDFGDILQATSAAAGTTRVVAQVGLGSVRDIKRPRSVRVKGSLAPRVTGSQAKLALYAGKPGQPLRLRDTEALRAGAGSYDQIFRLPVGVWRVQVRYLNPGVVETATSPVRRVRVR